jgi:hypothetical protein
MRSAVATEAVPSSFRRVGVRDMVSSLSIETTNGTRADRHTPGFF